MSEVESGLVAARVNDKAVKVEAQDPRLQAATVHLLDSTQQIFCVPKKAEGSELYAKVVDHLQLLEKEYFSLRYTDGEKIKHWLNDEKQISKQMKGRPYDFSFEAKFYPPDPTVLTDDVAKHLMYLQLCRDLDTGKLPASLAAYALLGSYVAQAELGDHDPALDYSKFLERHRFTGSLTEKLVDKLKDLHKQHRGKTSSEAEAYFLENAKKLALYGVTFCDAKSPKGFPVRIGISAHGIDVYREQVRLHRFLWQNIVKIAFKWNSFEIKLRHGELEKNNSVEYKLTDYDAAKRLWKCAVENHTFFRLIQPDEKPQKSFFRWGSARFQYRGRTQFQSKMASQMFDHPSATLPRDEVSNISLKSESVVGKPSSPLDFVRDSGRQALFSPAGDAWPIGILRRAEELQEESLSLESDMKKKAGKKGKSSEVIVEENEGTSNLENGDVVSEEVDSNEPEEGLLPHTTIESYHEGGVGPAYVVTDVDQHGNIIKRTTKTQQAKHTVQRQTYQTYTVPNEDGELGVQTVEASQQLITPIGGAAVANGTAPVIETRSHTVSYKSTDPTLDDSFDFSDVPGELISSRTISSGNRTFETITYKTEKNGIVETHVEHRVTIHSGGDIDHDAELSQAILEATDMNPDMTVEKIEVRQESQC